MLKIRLMRIGTKKRPFYRVVVVDERAKRNGAFIEIVGTYNPLTEPKEILLKQDRIDDWVKKGAQISHGLLRITGKAPQKPLRKPKKEPQEAKVVEEAKGTEETKEPEESEESKGTKETEEIKVVEEAKESEELKESEESEESKETEGEEKV